MSSHDFLRLLRSGKGMKCIYRAGDLGGMIAIYVYNQVFVLHWEEYRDGNHRNRPTYLRDEMHTFESADDVLTFVEKAGYPAAAFGP